MEDKVVFITGAASGIGQACAVGYARQGAKLALTDRNTLESTIQKCEEAGLPKEKIFCTLGDVTKEEDIQAIVDAAMEHYKKVDILLNIAGFAVPGTILDTSLDDVDTQYKVHVRAPFSFCQKLIPHLIKTKGSIVNLSSQSAHAPAYTRIAYCSMKAGLDHLTRCLALELSSHQVRVNSVNPATVRTQMPINYCDLKTEEEIEKFFSDQGRDHPLGRCASAEEIAEAVMFLADSSKSGFITGVNLLVDGGWMLKSGIA